MKHRLIPAKWIILGIGINLASWLYFDVTAFISCAIGSLFIILVFFLILLWKKNSIGWGDGVFFIFIASLFGGFFLILTFLLSFWLASLILVFFLSIKKISTKTKIPFVPFIVLGTMVTLFIGFIA
ncbi:MAG: hypothetical protein MJB14_13280 [Spirochaetes bacterium]|nr:hypothetical protein [Spirochaetota bacterium]